MPAPSSPTAGFTIPDAGDTGPLRESRGDTLRGFADRLGAAVIEAVWLVALLAIPIYVNIYSSRSFEPDKVATLTILAGMIVAAWLARALVGGALWPPAGTAPGGARGGPLLLVPSGAVLGAAVLSTALSVSPARSWQGSFYRQQGLATLLAYLVIALAVAAHMRRADQWRRAVMAVAIGSMPVCAYAIVQRLGLDTIVPPDDALRVASSLGNPIFLGAYIAMAFLVTLASLGLAPFAGGSETRRPVMRRVALGVVGLLQLAALVLSQSRGPLLGLGAGLVVLGVAWSLRAHYLGSPAGTPNLRRHAWALVLVAASAIIALLLLAAMPGAVPSRIRKVPTIGRLAAALDPSAPTARVRLLIWRGVVELETTAPPLGGSTGEADRFHRLRPIVGYGPDCFDLAFNRVFPAELGVVESRSSIPDRAHCETFDALVSGGALGVGAWLFLIAAALAVGGTLAVWGWAPRSVVRSALVGAIAGAAGLTSAATLVGRGDLAGALAPAGLVTGSCLALILTTLRSGPHRQPCEHIIGAEVALVAVTAVACHVVEASVGIAVTPTSLLLWFVLAALAAASLGRIAATPDTSVVPSAPPLAARERVVEALLAGIAIAVAASSLLAAPAIEVFHTFARSLPASFWAGAKAAGAAPAVVGLSAFAVAAALWAGRSAPALPNRLRKAALAAVAAPVVLAVLAKSQRLLTTARMQRDGAGIDELTAYVAGHGELFAVILVGLVLVLAVVLMWRSGEPAPPTPVVAIAGTLVTAFVIVAAALAAHQALLPIRADTFAKQAAAEIEGGQPLSALRLLSRASQLAPDEPSLLTLVARATVAASTVAATTEARHSALDAAVGALERAASMQPFDPDHVVNLGRVLTAAAASADDVATRRRLFERAERAYRRGLELRPGSVLFRTEHAAALVRLGRQDAAATELGTVLTLDPGYETAALMLAGLEHGRAVDALAAGNRDAANRHFEDALRALQNLLAHGGGTPVAERAIAALYARLGRGDDAVAALEALVDGREPAQVHEMLALLHLKAGRPERALEEAEAAVGLASADERARAGATLELVRGFTAQPLAANRESGP